MYKILIGIILSLIITIIFLTWRNSSLIKENQALNIAVEQQQQTIESIQENFKKQTSALNNLLSENQKIRNEVDNYLSIFRRHDLVKLSLNKPNLIQNRINQGTKNVFKDIHNSSSFNDTPAIN